jgi:hypothetical protein
MQYYKDDRFYLMLINKNWQALQRKDLDYRKDLHCNKLLVLSDAASAKRQ